jgi:hypothetical protein
MEFNSRFRQMSLNQVHARPVMIVPGSNTERTYINMTPVAVAKAPVAR